MADEKEKTTQSTEEKSMEEIDPDYVTGGAEIVVPNEVKGLTQTDHLQPCNCGKFSPNKGGVCGKNVCENCEHAKKLNDEDDKTYCSVQPQIIVLS